MNSGSYKKLLENRPNDVLGTLVKHQNCANCTKYLTLLHCEISDWTDWTGCRSEKVWPTDNLISRDASASKKGQRFSEESYGGAALVDFLAYRWQYLRLVLPVHKYMLQRHFSPFFQTNTKSNLLWQSFHEIISCRAVGANPSTQATAAGATKPKEGPSSVRFSVQIDTNSLNSEQCSLSIQ